VGRWFRGEEVRMQGVDGPQELKQPEKEPEYGENRYIFMFIFCMEGKGTVTLEYKD